MDLITELLLVVMVDTDDTRRTIDDVRRTPDNAMGMAYKLPTGELKILYQNTLFSVSPHIFFKVTSFKACIKFKTPNEEPNWGR